MIYGGILGAKVADPWRVPDGFEMAAKTYIVSWSGNPGGYFSKDYNINKFKSKFKRYLSHMFS